MKSTTFLSTAPFSLTAPGVLMLGLCSLTRAAGRLFLAALRSWTAGRLHSLEQPQVELTTVHIDGCHCHADGIAQTEQIA